MDPLTMSDTELKIRDWDRRMKAAPTFEEVRDVEFIRRSGRINMITDDLLGELYKRGRYEGVLWLLRCKENKVAWPSLWDDAMTTFQKTHGPVDTWFTQEILDSWEESEIRNEEEQLQRRLKDLQSRRNRLRSQEV